MNMKNLRQEVLKYYRRAYEERLMAGTSGNASAFCAEEGAMVITPSGVDVRELDEASLVVIDLEGRVLEGALVPSSEWRMHAEIYKNVPGALSVLHTHSEYATAFAVAGKPIPEILVEMSCFTGGEIRVCGYAPPGTAELGRLAALRLREGPVCLMQNHGVAAVGENVKSAYLGAVYAEDAARIYSHAKLLGEPLIIGKS